MDWIERIFGISPDGGSGAIELLAFMIPVLVLCVLCGVWAEKRRGG
jgi:hypothetical protein